MKNLIFVLSSAFLVTNCGYDKGREGGAGSQLASTSAPTDFMVGKWVGKQRTGIFGGFKLKECRVYVDDRSNILNIFVTGGPNVADIDVYFLKKDVAKQIESGIHPLNLSFESEATTYKTTYKATLAWNATGLTAISAESHYKDETTSWSDYSTCNDLVKQ